MNDSESAGQIGSPTSTGNHASLVVLHRESEDGMVEMVSMTSRQLDQANDYPKWIFVMETGESTDQTPQQTANAGIQTELAQVENALKVEFDNGGQPIFSMSVRGDNGGTHTKHVFVGRILSGELRHNPPNKKDRNPRNGREEELGKPEFKEAQELWDLMNQRGKKFHRVALIKALSFLAQDPRVMKKYWKLLESSQTVE